MQRRRSGETSASERWLNPRGREQLKTNRAPLLLQSALDVLPRPPPNLSDSGSFQNLHSLLTDAPSYRGGKKHILLDVREAVHETPG
eukprot:3992372-Pyramimonas_sp.AAC.1